jgi:hypothetical protein
VARLFKRLWDAMQVADVDEALLARKLGVSRATVSSRLNVHTQWNLREMYAILKLINRPKEDLPVLFPENGQNEEGCSRGKTAGRANGAAAGRRPASNVVRLEVKRG